MKQTNTNPMKNFEAYNATRLHFGQGVVQDLGAAARKLGTHALLVYGGGSVKRNGSYQDTKNQLEKAGIGITEYPGIKPNPLVEDVRKATALGKEKGADIIVAVGGGSAIDSAKIVALSMATGKDAWDIMTGKQEAGEALPLVAVLTLAATGTEMNCVSVLQNPETLQKIGYRNELIYPAHSFLDPNYTLSVPLNYTAYGVVDLIAHCLEAWYGYGELSLSDRFIISIIEEAMEFGPPLLKDLQNYELRSKIMWAATNALNNLTIYGRGSGDWGVHALGHTLSFLYDTPHGASLSMFYPAWMRTTADRSGVRSLKLGKALFGVDTVEATADAFERLFHELGSPVRGSEAGIQPDRREEILELMERNGSGGITYPLSSKEREAIVDQVI